MMCEIFKTIQSAVFGPSTEKRITCSTSTPPGSTRAALDVYTDNASVIDTPLTAQTASVSINEQMPFDPTSQKRHRMDECRPLWFSYCKRISGSTGILTEERPLAPFRVQRPFGTLSKPRLIGPLSVQRPFGLLRWLRPVGRLRWLRTVAPLSRLRSYGSPSGQRALGPPNKPGVQGVLAWGPPTFVVFVFCCVSINFVEKRKRRVCICKSMNP